MTTLRLHLTRDQNEVTKCAAGFWKEGRPRQENRKNKGTGVSVCLACLQAPAERLGVWN